jgi:hypothetical protein
MADNGYCLPKSEVREIMRPIPVLPRRHLAWASAMESIATIEFVRPQRGGPARPTFRLAPRRSPRRDEANSTAGAGTPLRIAIGASFRRSPAASTASTSAYSSSEFLGVADTALAA